MTRLEAIKAIVETLPDEDVVVHANGAICRESFFFKNRKNNFYLLGSMGLASSVGLGIALGSGNRKVVILDGDGNLLMGMGTLAMIGSLGPENIIHTVLDNGVYGTTGNQPTLSPDINLLEIARGCGYRSSQLVQDIKVLSKAYMEIRTQPGPHFIHIRISPQIDTVCPRIPYTAIQIRDRFLDSGNK